MKQFMMILAHRAKLVAFESILDVVLGAIQEFRRTRQAGVFDLFTGQKEPNQGSDNQKVNYSDHG